MCPPFTADNLRMYFTQSSLFSLQRLIQFMPVKNIFDY